LAGLDPTTQLALLIRSQVATLRRQKQTSSASARKTVPGDDVAPKQDLASVVAQRVRTLNPDDPYRARKALRIFLEAVLLSELGQDLVGDPLFADMVDHVIQQMNSDPDLAAASAAAAKLLIESASD
jgi:hypothetical protein